MRFGGATGCVVLAALIAGCDGRFAQPANAAASDPMTDAFAKFGVNFTATCPNDWKLVIRASDKALPAQANTANGSQTLEIDVPPLPPHIPGFLPLGAVASGYVQDLKKRYPDQKVDEQSTAKIDGSDARRIVSSFQNNGKPWRELALLSVHGDHVYLITGNCDASAFDKTKTAFDALVASLKWTSAQ